MRISRCTLTSLVGMLALGTASPLSGQIPSNLRNHHADLNAAVSSQNVGKMRLAWRVETKAEVSHTPLIQGDRVFFADWGGNVYAVDFTTGRTIWKKQIEEPKEEWP
jgi:polyvinyl alcohol dehydrogenase (cytochrome)